MTARELFGDVGAMLRVNDNRPTPISALRVGMLGDEVNDRFGECNEVGIFADSLSSFPAGRTAAP